MNHKTANEKLIAVKKDKLLLSIVGKESLPVSLTALVIPWVSLIGVAGHTIVRSAPRVEFIS